MYKGCARYLVMPHVRHVYMVQPLIKPPVRHVCVLQPLVRPYIMHAHLSLCIAVSLKGRTIRIWSFGYGFTYATAMGCAGFRLLFSIIIVL